MAQKAHLAGEVQSRLPAGAGIWGERAQVVLIPAFTDVPGEPKAVLWRWQKVHCAVRDVLLHEIAEGQEKRTPCETPQRGVQISSFGCKLMVGSDSARMGEVTS